MDDGDLTTPIVTEFLGKDVGAPPQKVPADKGAASRSSGDIEGSVCPPLHRMHERRVVRSAGHMVIGVRMPSPDTKPAELAPFEDGAVVFSSREQNRNGGGASRAALVLACAVALGGVAVVVEGFSGKDKWSAQRLAARNVSNDAAAPVDSARPVQLLAMSDAPAETIRMASLSPAVVADHPGTSVSSDFIRVAQKDTPGLIAANVFGPAGAPIRLPVSLNGGRAEDYSFLMFRGLPPEVTLSAGFRLKESWAVSLRDMDNLFIEAPAQFQGSFKLEILLIKGRDTPAESRMITVEVVPADIQIPPTASARQQPVPGPQVLTAAPRTIEPVERVAPSISRAAPATGQSSSVSPQQEEMMMGRATALLASKDIMSARLVLEHLGTNGSAKGALAMGKTFDPAYLQSMDVAGVKPDVAKARQWYKRAADLGETEASARLNALASR
jgi:hypothetical protein